MDHRGRTNRPVERNGTNRALRARCLLLVWLNADRSPAEHLPPATRTGPPFGFRVRSSPYQWVPSRAIAPSVFGGFGTGGYRLGPACTARFCRIWQNSWQTPRCTSESCRLRSSGRSLRRQGFVATRSIRADMPECPGPSVIVVSYDWSTSIRRSAKASPRRSSV